ncbi:hypothetical protein BO71DRAFT_400401 [Aspergillus ellipticus CBS 707.79]|uniref:Uncharacterized protein n=1 Tax=Aspergillus ellipticus CBS 707.79 TaxID=1448320 RepID=A0A319D5J8_9EURO|nr:hypothetical protein BO71DRAFT_400401 [Aspergillus ellipticus CBS 707.79]
MEKRLWGDGTVGDQIGAAICSLLLHTVIPATTPARYPAMKKSATKWYTSTAYRAIETITVQSHEPPCHFVNRATVASTGVRAVRYALG